jgi:ATP-dependent Clp protease ATP-binding subunit ClpC
MEEGHLSDAKGQKVNFRNAIVIMTSNIGAETIKRGPNLGFAFQRDEAVEEKQAYAEMRKTLMEQLKRQFRPEFINRVDSIIVFRQLSQADIRKIVDIILDEVNERLVEHHFQLEATDGARDWLAKHGYDAEFGARPLRRLIQTSIEDKLSDAVLSGEFKDESIILVDADEETDEITLRHQEVEKEDEEAVPAA